MPNVITNTDAIKEDNGIPSLSVVPSGPTLVAKLAMGNTNAQDARSKIIPPSCRLSLLRRSCPTESFVSYMSAQMTKPMKKKKIFWSSQNSNTDINGIVCW
mmetsp:Transcript_14228/g.26632  ORF Transcript_14228/g.26632 Transcript_14228/m.26632 type:complete len:101 (+) Transcript_14228:1072-1374(+)